MKISAILTLASAEIGRYPRSHFPNGVGHQRLPNRVYELLEAFVHDEHGITFDHLLNYGCWCRLLRPGGQVPFGQGEPVDRLDWVCKEWHQCRACTKLDENGDQCNPNEVYYDLHYTWGQVYSSYKCPDDYPYSEFCCHNDDFCARHNCQCDVSFAYKLAKIHRYDNYEPANVIKSDGTGFDESQCISLLSGPDNAGAGQLDEDGKPVGFIENGRSCCGVYPNRFPYRTDRETCCDEDHGGFLVPYGAC